MSAFASHEGRLRTEVARAFGVDEDALRSGDVVRISVPERRCECFVFDGRRTDVAWETIERYCPRPDPFVEALTALALAAHEAQKSRG